MPKDVERPTTITLSSSISEKGDELGGVVSPIFVVERAPAAEARRVGDIAGQPLAVDLEQPEGELLVRARGEAVVDEAHQFALAAAMLASCSSSTSSVMLERT